MAERPEKLTGSKLETGKFPETIDANIRGVPIQMGPDNFAEVMKSIEKSLQPGMPVYIEEVKRGSGILDRPYTVGHVFISDGSLNENGQFNMLWGKQHSASAHLYADDLRIYAHQNGSGFDRKINVPSQWVDEGWNEGTFSQSGGWRTTTYGAGGTNRVIIGNELRRKLPEAIRGIEFVQDAISVSLPQFYMTETYRVSRKGEFEKGRDELDKEHAEIAVSDTISFTVKMIRKAMKKLDDDYYKKSTTEKLQRVRYKDYSDLVDMREVHTFSNGKTGIDDVDGYRLEPDDFIFYEMRGQQRNIGYFKIHRGFHGHGFFVPARSMKQVANLAFDPKFIKQFFPEG